MVITTDNQGGDAHPKYGSAVPGAWLGPHPIEAGVYRSFALPEQAAANTLLQCSDGYGQPSAHPLGEANKLCYIVFFAIFGILASAIFSGRQQSQAALQWPLA